MYSPRTDPVAEKARKAVTAWALTCETEVYRVIVLDGEGRLLGGLTTELSDRRKPVAASMPLGNGCKLTPILVRVLIAWEKGEEALDLPGDAVLYARRIKH